MITATPSATFRTQLAPSDTLFERLGGYPGIRLTMQQLFERIVDDPDLSPAFGRVDFEHHVATMSAVVATVAGVIEPFSRRDMAAAYRHLRVTSEQFDRMAAHLGDMFAGGVDSSAETVRELLALVESLRSQLVIVRAVPNAYPR